MRKLDSPYRKVNKLSQNKQQREKQRGPREKKKKRGGRTGPKTVQLERITRKRKEGEVAKR